jgi:hypothetical protein
MDLPLHGLMFALVACATGAVAMFGAAVQAIVFAARAPTGSRLSHSLAGASGPLVAVGIAALAFKVVDDVSMETARSLDDGWLWLPSVALVAWFALTLRARASTRRREIDDV